MKLQVPKSNSNIFVDLMYMLCITIWVLTFILQLTPLDRKGKSISGRCRPSEQDADCEGNHPCCSCFGFCGFTDDHCTTYSWEKLGTGICPNRTSSDEEYE